MTLIKVYAEGNENIVSKLEMKAFRTIEKLLTTSSTEIASIIDEKIETIIKFKSIISRKITDCNGLRGIQLRNDQETGESNSLFQSSGIDTFDNIIHGGFPSQRIIELSGQSLTGKSRICLSTAISSAIRGCEVLFVDTSNNVHPSRLKDLIITAVSCHIISELSGGTLPPKERFQALYQQTISHLNIIKVVNFWQLVDLMSQLSVKCPYQLIIVDSFMTLLYPLREAQIGIVKAPTNTSILKPSNSIIEREYLDSLLSSLTLLMKNIVCDEIMRPTIICTMTTNADKLKNSRVIDSYVFNELFDLSIQLTRLALSQQDFIELSKNAELASQGMIVSPSQTQNTQSFTTKDVLRVGTTI